VLSIVATQVQTVQEAVKKYSVIENREEKYRHLPAGCPPFTVGKFHLQGDEITLMPTVGIWITMNPGEGIRSSQGSRGREDCSVKIFMQAF
jgi:dynein heavy chain